MKQFQGGLVFKAHRLLYHSTLGSRVIKKRRSSLGLAFTAWTLSLSSFNPTPPGLAAPCAPAPPAPMGGADMGGAEIPAPPAPSQPRTCTPWTSAGNVARGGPVFPEALFRWNVDGFLPEALHDNLTTVRQLRMTREVPPARRLGGPPFDRRAHLS